MGILDVFKDAFRRQVKLAGEKALEEREIDEIIKSANNLFITEEGERNLLTSEINLTHRLFKSAAEAFNINRNDPDAKLLLNISLYLRSHTIDKLNALKNTRRDLAAIVAEAEEGEKNDKIIRAITLSEDPQYRRIKLKEKLHDLDTVVSAMHDIKDKAEDIKRSLNIIEKNTENMLLIIEGGSQEPGFRNVQPLLRLLEFLKSADVKRFIITKRIVKKLQEVLAKEFESIHLLRRKIKAVEFRGEKVLRLVKKYAA